MRRPLALIATALLILACGASTATARTKALAPGFFGTTLTPDVTSPGGISDGTLADQVGVMARNRVRSLRVTFNWLQIETAQGKFDWSSSDRFVAPAARHHLSLLPIVIGTPRWASSRPSYAFWDRVPPRKPSLYAGFMRALVKRYGPKGTFWRTHRVPKDPIRAWQVWNEPSQCFYWQTDHWYKTYVPMLKAAHAAVHKLDRKATVVTAGLSGGPNGCHDGRVTNSTNHPSWDDLSTIYKHGGKGAFDAVAVQQYTNAEGSQFTTGHPTKVASSVSHLLQVVAFNREVIHQFHGAGSTQILLTEFGWPTAYGRLASNRYYGIESTVSGADKRVRGFYTQLRRNAKVRIFSHARDRFVTWRARSLNITRAYYFAWSSAFVPASGPFSFSGLMSWTKGQPFQATPMLARYRKAAAAASK